MDKIDLWTNEYWNADKGQVKKRHCKQIICTLNMNKNAILESVERVQNTFPC